MKSKSQLNTLEILKELLLIRKSLTDSYRRHPTAECEEAIKSNVEAYTKIKSKYKNLV